MDLFKDILLILAIQLVYVPTFTMRTIFLVRGQSKLAAILGFFESLIYVFGLTLVLSGDKDILTMFFYAVGYGLGILIGTAIEQKLAYGYTTMQVNIESKNDLLISKLREEGYGVTIYEGYGRDTKRYKLEILMKRNKQHNLFSIVESYEPRAFIVAYEPRQFKGGFLLSHMKKVESVEPVEPVESVESEKK